MRARSRSLLLAGLLLAALCSVQHAAAARSTSGARTLKQAEPTGAKLPMGVKKQKPMSASEVMAMAAATGALLPACVPKYVSDLVIPPPMPVTTQPLTEAAARRHGKEAGAGRSLLAADIAEPAAVDRTRKRSSDSAVALAAAAASSDNAAAAAAEPQKEETVVKPKKVKEVYDIDDDYWGAIYAEPKQDKKKKKSKAAAEETPAPAPSPAPTPQDAAAGGAQPVPLPQEGQPLVDPTMPSYTGYDISVRQISQDVLPQAPHSPNTLPGCPAFFKPTDVLAYGPANVPGTPFHAWPAYTIEAQHTYETRVRWTNDLVDNNGNYIPHLLREAIDQTLTWANPSAVGGDTDMSPCAECKKTDSCKSDTTCKIAGSTTYNGPVPLVTHLHGQNGVADYSDGYPEAWYLPKAKNLLAYKNVGGWYQTFKREYASATGNRWNQGSFTAIYKNSERPGTQWFHDNTLGITRLNTYAGLSGFYFVRERFPSLANGPELPGLPYPAYDGTTDPLLVRELPLAIQDRAFTNESQLWYPVADHLENSSMPDSGVPPRSLPEFSATVTANGIPVNMVMMTVNGRTYPRQTVHPDAYRLRILNGCNTRTLQLRFARSNKPSINPLSPIDGATLLPFYVVGNEGGFFPQIQPPMTTLQMGPGERYDLVVDFSSVMPGEFVYMLNNGPEPDTALYDGTNNGVGLTEHTAQVMRFDVVSMPPDVKPRPFTADEQCALNTAMKLHWEATSKPIDRTAPFVIKRLTLLDKTTPDGTPLIVQMGTADATRATLTPWEQQVVNNAPMNTTQFWDIINLTPDAIPVHLHNSDFRFVGRWGVDVDPAHPHAFEDTDVPVTNPDLDPLLQVQCSFDASGRCAVPRDTMLMLPSTRTRIAFNAPTTQGLYTWNAQALEAQDNAMLAPYCAGTPLYIDPRRPGQRMCPQPPAK